MKRIILNEPERVIPFVDAKIANGEHFPEDCVCFGVEEDGEVIGGVVFTGYDGVGMVMHSAGSNRLWVTKTLIRVVFSYPFKQLGCRRLSTMVRADNPHAHKFALHAGFKLEGTIRQAEPDGTDLMFYGMLADECRWLEDEDGKEK